MTNFICRKIIFHTVQVHIGTSSSFCSELYNMQDEMQSQNVKPKMAKPPFFGVIPVPLNKSLAWLNKLHYKYVNIYTIVCKSQHMIANFSSSELYKYTEMITPGKIPMFGWTQDG